MSERIGGARRERKKQEFKELRRESFNSCLNTAKTKNTRCYLTYI